MPFLHPAIFWTGLAAATAPIIIHLLNRRRFRVRDWAAMQFLLESLRRNRRRLRLEELLLMALRCLVILLAGAAMARFTGCAAAELLPGAGSQAAVFVLDDSCSMGQTRGGGTIFSAATTDLARRVKSLSKSDQVAILLASASESEEPFFKLTHVANADVESLATRLAGVRPSDRRANIASALAAADKVFKDAAGAKRLFFLGDFRREDLLAQDAKDIRRQYQALRSLGVDLVALDYGREPSSNLTVQSIELLDRFVSAGMPARIGVTVRNNSPVRAENVELRVKARLPAAGGAGTSEVSLPVQRLASIEPGEAQRAEFQVTSPRHGPAVVSAELPADELAGDNAARLAIAVRQAVKVLVVDGQPEPTNPVEGESFFFVRAIDPNGDGGYGYRPEVISREGLAEADFEAYDLVVLLNVQDFPAGLAGADPYPSLSAMERYVRGGGGLAIFTGDRVNVDFYRGQFYRDGEGLCPLPIRARQGDPASREQFWRLDPKSIASDGLLRTFCGEGAVLTTVIRLFAFSPAESAAAASSAPELKPPVVLARLTDVNRSPAVVWRQYYEGAVVLFCTTASKRWNDWPDDQPRGVYVGPMLDLVAALARRQKETLTATVGQPIAYDLARDERDAKALLKTPRFPAQDLIPLAAQRNGDARLKFQRAIDAGEYELALHMPDGSMKDVLFARNVDGREGDLTPGRKADLAAALGSEEFIYVERSGQGDPTTEETFRAKEYWLYAMVAAMVLMAVETFLGQRFGHYS